MLKKTIFISYAHEDKKIAFNLKRSLNNAGFDVWWDEELQTGQKWAQEIDKALLSATAVIVLWSKHAISSEWVQHEASIAKIHDVLTHVIIEDVSVPDIFGTIQHSNLSTWNYSNDDPNFLHLVSGIKDTQWRNKTQQWRKSIIVSLSTLAVSLLLIYGGFKLQTRFAGPINVVMGWGAGADYVRFKLNLKEIEKFYTPERWDIAFLCSKKGEQRTLKNTIIAVIPFGETLGKKTEETYKINFHPPLEPRSTIECYISVINKNYNLNSYTHYTKNNYNSFKLIDINEKSTSPKNIEKIILKKKLNYILVHINPECGEEEISNPLSTEPSNERK